MIGVLEGRLPTACRLGGWDFDIHDCISFGSNSSDEVII